MSLVVYEKRILTEKASVKLSVVGTPFGREASRISRLAIFDKEMSWVCSVM